MAARAQAAAPVVTMAFGEGGFLSESHRLLRSGIAGMEGMHVKKVL